MTPKDYYHNEIALNNKKFYFIIIILLLFAVTKILMTVTKNESSLGERTRIKTANVNCIKDEDCAENSVCNYYGMCVPKVSMEPPPPYFSR